MATAVFSNGSLTAVSGSEGCQSRGVGLHRPFQHHSTQVDLKYLLPLWQCGQVNGDLSVEPARSEQSLIQDIHTISGGQNDHSLQRIDTCSESVSQCVSQLVSQGVRDGGIEGGSEGGMEGGRDGEGKGDYYHSHSPSISTSSWLRVLSCS